MLPFAEAVLCRKKHGLNSRVGLLNDVVDGLRGSHSLSSLDSRSCWRQWPGGEAELEGCDVRRVTMHVVRLRMPRRKAKKGKIPQSKHGRGTCS